MLGVRREGVSEAAQVLQSEGLIRCTRGHISVLDRRGLERRSCECCSVVRNEYDRLLTAPLRVGATSARRPHEFGATRDLAREAREDQRMRGGQRVPVHQTLDAGGMERRGDHDAAAALAECMDLETERG